MTSACNCFPKLGQLNLCDVCHARAAKYGDTADECGEAFFLCGKSLLELARLVNLIAHFENIFVLYIRFKDAWNIEPMNC